MSQLLAFLDGTGSLPSKPLLITFDDARADSFKYADPVLEETGFRATMFVPVEDVASHQPYAAVWTVLRKMSANGRWDMQCHGSDAQHYIPVDAEGHLGHFLANKMWLKDTNRLETDPEFAARIEQDMQTCKQTVARELPDTKVFAFAFPYGDQGHRSLSNAPEAFSINQATVKKQFSLAFNVDNTYLATSDTPRFILPRFEVPRSYSGADLIQQLKTIDPILSTSYKLAHLDVESGRYGQALTIINTLDKEGAIDKAELLTTSGKISNWSGDHAGARSYLNSASALRPNDPLIQQEITKLDHRLGFSAQMNGLYFEDNADRRFYSFGPSLQYGVSDRLSVAAYYKYLDFKQTLSPARTGVSTEQHFETNGNQLGGQFNYELAARSHLSLSAGVADFSENNASPPAKSGVTFPVGNIELTSGLGDNLDVSIAADHTYVNTAAAILNDIAFTRVKGGATYKISDPLSVGFNHAYFDYTDNNQRNRTEVSLDSKVLHNPNVSVGALFVHDDTQTNNPLFWTPNSYMSFSIPVNVEKKWGESFVTELALAPGMGKEANNSFDFQFNGAGSVKWNVKDNLSLSLSLNRYQAATYSNFSAFLGVFVKF
jgi:peptidoglycan/xylan/chitin deacetylase (PgdA/CDA1 family)